MLSSYLSHLLVFVCFTRGEMKVPFYEMPIKSGICFLYRDSAGLTHSSWKWQYNFFHFLHGEDGSYCIQGGNEDAGLTDKSCQQEGPCGFSVGFSVAKDLQGQHGKHINNRSNSVSSSSCFGCTQQKLETEMNIWQRCVNITDPEGGHDVVLGDGLQKARSSRQTLKACPARGEEGANHDHPRRRPSQRANHQVPVDSLTEPEGGRSDRLIACRMNLTLIEFRGFDNNTEFYLCTHLSLRTTPSMQAPNRNTLDMS